jgi:Cof subfamily protein (haloacid dehalogenase superfamily)
MIRLIAIDLDGTLFNYEQKISPANRQALQNALQNGIQLAIVTGRGQRGAEMALDMLDLDLPYISSAGALLRSGRDGETLHAWTFHQPAELAHVIAFARQSGAGMIAEIPVGTPYWFGSDALGAAMDPMTAKEAWRSVRTHAPEQDFDRPLLKATLVAETAILRQAEILLRDKCPSLHYTYAGPTYIDLTADGVNKGTALRELAQKQGLMPEEVAAIGDQAIDLYMLRYAGLPIAMSNAVPSLKEAAQWIAPSNDEDGVAWAIEKIIQERN